jgi:signal transduction histidine kinase/CheY-like chemotaxis protein
MDHLRFFSALPQRSTPPDPTHQALDDIVRESLVIVLPATVVCVWAWAAYAVLFSTPLTDAAYLSLALVSISGFGAHQLAGRHLRAAVALYLGGLFATVTLLVWAIGPTQAVMLYVPFVVVVAMLSSMPLTLAVALLCALLAALIGLQGGQERGAALLPAFLIGITALAALVSSRRLYTALGWALNMTTQARRNAEEAQTNRAELRRVLQTLDIAYDRLERTNRALIFAQESAEKAYRFKSEFVANVSHELRTPLNLIVGFSEMMATAPESYGGMPLPRAYRGDMLATYRNACHLLELINDVLDLSQLEAGQLPLTKQRLDLREVIHEAKAMVQGLADARGLELQVVLPDEPLPLLMDRTRIRQVLLNLLTNAMRYTEHGYVRIAVTVAGNEGGGQSLPPNGNTAPARLAVAEQTPTGAANEFVTVAVSDSGRGIDAANLHRAFEAFSRLDEAQIRDGSGLGLAISKKFIELHEGHISIESELGKGTCVSFTLPLPEVRSLPRAAVRLNRPLADLDVPARVLVLHDDPRTLSILRRHVEACDFHLAADGIAAQTALADLPDAILQDLNFGGLAMPALPGHVPQITCPLPSMRHLGLLMGADDYLPKPVTRDDLAAALGRLPQAPKTALLVDDDPHVVRLLSRMLLTLAPELHFYEAFNGQEALQIARSQRPDVIFLDLNMPELGGRAVIEALLADWAATPDFARIPIVVVSVRNVEEEGAPLHGDVVISRPDGFTLTELLNLLNAVLRCLTRPEAVSPASAAARLQESPG